MAYRTIYLAKDFKMPNQWYTEDKTWIIIIFGKLELESPADTHMDIHTDMHPRP